MEVANNWAYFCSLCKILDDTTQYIDHGNEENKSVNSFGLKHGRNVNYKEQATLENAQNALAALLALEITYVKKATGDANILKKIKCFYYSNPDIVYDILEIGEVKEIDIDDD